MKLDKISTRAPEDLHKERIKKRTSLLHEQIGHFQKVLYAEKQHSLLIVLQGVDASGKDGLIAGVFTGLNPLGVNVSAFKAPSDEELAHDFLWRIHQECPERGIIQVFNRSHYEDVLVPVVNGNLAGKALKARLEDINAFERMLENNGTIILKFYLHISREEQLIRLKERKQNPEKFWKHNDDDWAQRRKWNSYMDVYHILFRECNNVPWQIVPADQNWYKEYVVASAICRKLKAMNLKYPELKTKK